MNRPRSFVSFASTIKRFLPKYLYALFVTPFLFTAGVFFPGHRFLIFQIARHFGLKIQEVAEIIPCLPLASVLDEEINLNLLEPIGASGNVTLLELMVIATLAKQAALPTAFEIGTFDGRTTANIAANLGSGGEVYTLDLPQEKLGETKYKLARGEKAFVEKEVSGKRLLHNSYRSTVTQLLGDSAFFDFSPYVGRMGLVFIDASHSYEYVRKDTLTAINLTHRESSIILWHDYQQDWPGVIQALNEFYRSGKEFTDLRRIEGTSLVILKRGKNAGYSA